MYFHPLVFPQTMVTDYSSCTLVEDEAAFLPQNLEHPLAFFLQNMQVEKYSEIFISFIFMWRSVWKRETGLGVFVFTSWEFRVSSPDSRQNRSLCNTDQAYIQLSFSLHSVDTHYTQTNRMPENVHAFLGDCVWERLTCHLDQFHINLSGLFREALGCHGGAQVAMGCVLKWLPEQNSRCAGSKSS